ncbi:MAG TPA: helix-turn-helix domain-containing protein [Acidimicrobiales bacterium]|nr:helix-turn-helix domain-containing protein [Acidimicrobiales bacterium]
MAIVGYRGKVVEQEQARELRAQAWTIPDIAVKLGVSKSSVSLWVRDVQFTPSKRRTGGRRRGPNALQRRKEALIERLDREGVSRLGVLSEQAFLVAGAALYAGEGSKTDGAVKFANSDPRISGSSASGFVGSSPSTRAACASGSTCTKASTSTPLSRSGRT